MTLLELVVWMVIGFTGYQFWRTRAISERTNAYLKQYCDKHGLQLLSVARAKTRFSFKYGKPQTLMKKRVIRAPYSQGSFQI